MTGPGILLRLAGIAAGILVVATTASAFTASNTVPATYAGRQQFTIDANALKPAACAALNLTAVVVGSTGTAASELVLGTAGADTMNAKGGDDCVLGGGGNDSITGGAGIDVCIGGPGTDTFATCETQIQ